MKAILLASGGMDSTTLAYWLLKKNISYIPVFINYGQHCAKTELNTLKNVLPATASNKIEVLDVRDIYRNSKSRLIVEPNLWKDEVSSNEFYLPYRNLFFFTTGAIYAQSHGISTIYAGFINSSHAKEIDCSEEFFKYLTVLLADIGSVELKLPLRELSKYEVTLLGIELGAPIAHTFSCQASSVVPCGACPNCVDRLEALHSLQS